MPKIAIGCIVRNRAWILPEYLQAIENISWEKKEYIFLENSSTDRTFIMLQEFMERQSPQEYRVWLGTAFTQGMPGHERNQYNRNNYEYLAALRNIFLFMFYMTKADYLLSIDSDIIVSPFMLRQLLHLADHKTIVAAAISNIPGKCLDGHVPGNFMINQEGILRHPPAYPLQGTMEVDVTGAVYLIPYGAVKDGIRYAPHPQGEDIPFCLQAKKLGYKMIVTFDALCDHRMVESVSCNK